MSVLMSWARSTVASIEHALRTGEDYFDRILVGVLLLLAVTVTFLFTR
jgi:hypothetical protein